MVDRLHGLLLSSSLLVSLWLILYNQEVRAPLVLLLVGQGVFTAILLGAEILAAGRRHSDRSGGKADEVPRRWNRSLLIETVYLGGYVYTLARVLWEVYAAVPHPNPLFTTGGLPVLLAVVLVLRVVQRVLWLMTRPDGIFDRTTPTDAESLD